MDNNSVTAIAAIIGLAAILIAGVWAWLGVDLSTKPTVVLKETVPGRSNRWYETFDVLVLREEACVPELVDRDRDRARDAAIASACAKGKPLNGETVQVRVESVDRGCQLTYSIRFECF